MPMAMSVPSLQPYRFFNRKFTRFIVISKQLKIEGIAAKGTKFMPKVKICTKLEDGAKVHDI